MKLSTRALLSSALLAGSLLSAGAVTATAAHAAGGCSGTLIGRKAITYSGSTIGELAVYYNSSTGNNCAQTNHLGASYGVKAETTVTIERCTQTTKQDIYCTPVSGTYSIDKNDYAYFAGPVSVHSPNNCIRATGLIAWKGSRPSALFVGGC